MAQIENPRKDFAFTLLIAPDPINPFLVQEVIIPESAHDVVEHGDINFDVKTAGRTKFTTIKLKKIMTTDGADNYIWDWFLSCNDVIIGGGVPPGQYKKVITIYELAEDQVSVLNTWVLNGCWPSKVGEMTLSRQGEDNTIESIELCVDQIEKL